MIPSFQYFIFRTLLLCKIQTSGHSNLTLDRIATNDTSNSFGCFTIYSGSKIIGPHYYLVRPIVNTSVFNQSLVENDLPSSLVVLYTVSQKRHLTLAHNFTKY